jgi:hypothetical protein
MQPDRVVEVVFGTLSAGSGYLMSPLHVLTARHVCVPQVLGSPCTVRRLTRPEDAANLVAAQRPAPVDATLGWMSDSQDIAVLDLKVPMEASLVPGQAADGPIPFGAAPGQDDVLSRHCIGIGFPAASRQDDRTVEGGLSWVFTSRRFDVNVTNGIPARGENWGGCSGTMLLVGGVPMAVAIIEDPLWAGAVLQAAPVGSLLDDPGFIAHLAKAGMPPPERRVVSRVTTSLRERISARVHRIDRGEQAEAILGHVRKLPARAPPQIFLVPGVDEDEHRLLIDRLRREPAIFRCLGKQAGADAVIRTLNWPMEPTIDAEARFQDMLLEPLHAALGLEPPVAGAPPDYDRLLERMHDGVSPRGFWVFINRANAFGGHGALLRRWFGFWEEMGKRDPGPPVLLFLCLAWDDPPKREAKLLSFLRRAEPKPDPDLEPALEDAAERKQFMELAQLAHIRAADLHPWIDELRQACQPAPAEQFDALRFALVSRIGEGKRMRGLSIDIANLLESMESGPREGASP